MADAYQPLAIVGLACRLPGGCDTPSRLWEALISGQSCRGEVPKSRFNIDAFYHPDYHYPASLNSHEGHFLDHDIREFDHEFFSINSPEAVHMDPQQRQLLEVAFECIESAGITLEDVTGQDIGCYIGNFTTDFALLQTKDPEMIHRYSATGTGTTILANRISHCFNLKGPSVTIDTACSSSIYALHQACAALRSGECDAAFVGGANLIQTPDLYFGTVKAGMTSGTGACHTFDISADGYAKAEGVGVLLVKRLGDAIRAGDPIRSVIRGTAVNSNGKTNGISLPDPSGQEAVIRKAYTNARLVPNCTDYVEAHGTGTEVGDGIEIDALSRVLRHKTGNATLIGSVKTNLGHSEAVSGISSLIKMTLALENGVIPQTIGVKTINPKLLLEERNVRIATSNTLWPSGDVRRASINSFGYGGSNGHVILEGAESHVTLSTSSSTGTPLHCRVIPLSARSDKGLQLRRNALAKLERTTRLADVAYTLSCRRSHFESRGFLVVTDEEWTSLSESKPMKTALLPKKKPEIVFAFTGQGAQWPTMGAVLIHTCQRFAETIDSLDSYLSTIPEAPKWRLRDVLTDSDPSRINEAAVAQPACTALQIGLVSLLTSIGVSPVHVIGHSSGEIAAAYAAGSITAQEAISLSYYRGLAVSRITTIGAMGVLGCDEQTVESLIEELGYAAQVEIACFNSAKNITISGDAMAVKKAIAHAQNKNIFAREFNTGNKAYHSRHMAQAGERYHELIATLFTESKTARDKSITMTSTLRAQALGRDDVRDSRYWRDNLEKPVLFSQAMGSILAEHECHVIEIGPHSTFRIALMDIFTASSRTFRYTPTLIRSANPILIVSQLAGNLFLDGFNDPVKKLNNTVPPFTDGTVPVTLTNLPPYPWKRGPLLWNEGRISSEYRQRTYARHELLGAAIVGGSRNIHAWRNILKLRFAPWIRDHKLGDIIVFPAAAYIAMAVEGFQQVVSADNPACMNVVLRDIKFLSMLTLDDEEEDRELFTELSPVQDSSVSPSQNNYCFTISSFSSNEPTIHCRGTIEIGDGVPLGSSLRSQSDFMPALPTESWYNTIRKEGLGFGAEFRRLNAIQCARDNKVLEVLAECSPIGAASSTGLCPVHPTIIDSLFQACLISTTSGVRTAFKGKIPVSIDKLTVFLGRTTGKTKKVRASSRFGSQYTAVCEAEMRDDGKELVVLSGLQFVPWLKHDFNLGAPPREPFLKKVWMPLSEIEQDEKHFRAGLSNGTRPARVQAPGLLVTLGENQAPTTTFCNNLSARTGIAFEMMHFENSKDYQDMLPQAFVIVCLEANQPMLCHMDEERMESMQTILRLSRRVLWIHSADYMGRGQPQFSLVSGFFRAVALEQPNLELCTFDIGKMGLEETTCANLAYIVENMQLRTREREYSQHQGVLHVPRFQQEPEMDEAYRHSERDRTQTSLEEARNCQLSIGAPGMFATLAFQARTEVPVLAPDHVEVHVKAASINAKNSYSLRGLANTHNATCSDDFSGVITRVGSAVPDLAPGDRVTGMSPNRFNPCLQVPHWACCKLEKDESFMTMAAVPVVFTTALYALEHLAQLKGGETVLIHSAAGGAGIAAIKVAQIIGARIFATVGTETKKEYLVQNLGIPRENIYSSRDTDFVSGILRSTSGAGVDVVFNSLTGKMLHASWDLCADFGRFIDVSLRDSLDGGRLHMRPFSRGVMYRAFNLSDIYYANNHERKAFFHKLLCDSIALVRTKNLVHATPLQVFDVSEIAEAFTQFGHAARMGKIVVSFEDPKARIPYRPRRYLSSFSSAKAYLLVGCLGGLGRALSSWMLEQGARQFLFMSRNGASSAAVVDHIKGLEARGAQVTILKGDVSRYEDVEGTVNSIQIPLGGVIHAAMNLDEAMFDNMTAVQWNAGLAPKVQGAWNLHRALSATPLDFFLVTSSVAGTVGLSSESNYCAANAYLDAFAHHRRQLGLPAISIALGCISEVGYLNERPDVEKGLFRKGLSFYDEDEVIKIVDTALAFANQCNGHIVTGLEIEGVHRLRDSGGLNGTMFDDVRLASLTSKAEATSNSNHTQTTTARSTLERDVDAAVVAVARGSPNAHETLLRCVCELLRNTLAGMLLVDNERVAQEAHLDEFGMDSMLAAEFRTVLSKRLRCDVPLAVLLREGMDISTLGAFVVSKIT